MATPTAINSAISNPSTRPPLRFRHPSISVSEEDAFSAGDDSSSDNEGSTTAVDTSSAEDNYVRKVLAKEKPLPPINWMGISWLKEINYISTAVLTVVPGLAIYGAMTTKVDWRTVVWSLLYYLFTGLGVTAGFHRLWAHRSYTASIPLQYFLALAGSGAVQGSIRWWSRGHRAHHRYTDTDLDPYSAHKGLVWSHVGWMIVKPRRKPGVADVKDLSNDKIVMWQHKWYLPLMIGMGLVVPTVVAGLGWGDWRGGFYFAGAARLLFVHHSTFCINSLAHWLGETPFDDKHSPKDHWITALFTVGEGYHNFHHEFPQDFRNAIKWYQYDPTKWFIFTMYKLGLASQLKVFPDNEIRKGQIGMQLKKLKQASKTITWPTGSDDLPVISWDRFQEECKTRSLIVIGGFIHDVENFINEHPGGAHFLKSRLGKDATTAFYGGVYDHSNGAQNVLSMLRVGCIEGGYEVESLKKYSEVIKSLEESGDCGVGNKGADLAEKGAPTARKMTTIKGDPAFVGVGLVRGSDLKKLEFDGTELNGGLRF